MSLLNDFIFLNDEIRRLRCLNRDMIHIGHTEQASAR